MSMLSLSLYMVTQSISGEEHSMLDCDWWKEGPIVLFDQSFKTVCGSALDSLV